MATDAQRAQSLADALTNRATPQATVNTLGRALALREGCLLQYDTEWTVAQRATYLVKASRRVFLPLYDDLQIRDAVEAAKVAGKAQTQTDLAEG